MSNARELLHAIGERIGAQGGVERVYGHPISAEGRTIVPVAQVRFGFGAGSGSHRRGTDDKEDADGGGGGGGLQAVPVGVIEVTGAGTRFIRFNAWQPIAAAIAVGFVAGWLARRR